MRTTSWYSPAHNRASPIPKTFCTGGHDWPGMGGMTGHWSADSAHLAPHRNVSRPLLRLPVKAGNFFGIQVQTLAQLRRRFPLSALVR